MVTVGGEGFGHQPVLMVVCQCLILEASPPSECISIVVLFHIGKHREAEYEGTEFPIGSSHGDCDGVESLHIIDLTIQRDSAIRGIDGFGETLLEEGESGHHPDLPVGLEAEGRWSAGMTPYLRLLLIILTAWSTSSAFMMRDTSFLRARMASRTSCALSR